MMAARKPCSPGSFFGKGFPRAIGKLGDENKLLKTDNSPQLPNAPLLQWAGKADWSAGGAAPKRIGKTPKPPINPEDAYALYLQSRVTLPPAGEQGSDNAEDDILALKHDAAVEALKSWAMLSENEKKIFEDIAKEDRVRFQEEAVHYEVRNPGWFGAWLKRQSAPDAPGGTAERPAGGRRAGRPRPPLTPWTAFVQATLDTLKKSHPDAAAGVKHVELMRMAMEEAAPIYKSLSAEEKARYIKIAEEDKERYEKELEAMPAWKKAKLSHKGTKKAKKGRSTKARMTQDPAPRAKRAAGKEDQAEAEEEEEAVDTTGMNAMQAWAAKQRAARRRAERKPTAPSRRSKKAAQDGGAAEEEVDSVGAERQEAAELATLPDEAYIRTRATGDSDDSSDGDDDGDISDDDEDDEDGADSAHEDMSDIVETQINDTQLDEPTTQGTEDGGVLSRVRTVISAGLGWLTTTKRRGLLRSMQDVPMTQEDGDAEDEGENAGLEGQWVGRPVLKKFGRVQRPGTVKSFNRRTRMYQVEFEGGIKETLLVSAVKNILQPVPSTAGLRGGRAPTPRKLEALYNKEEAPAAGPKRRKRAK